MAHVVEPDVGESAPHRRSGEPLPNDIGMHIAAVLPREHAIGIWVVAAEECPFLVPDLLTVTQCRHGGYVEC
jgi:hypothetical protein